MSSSSVKFADDWPVQAEDPLEMALDQPFLPTHEALKACSGSDIHLVKGASNPSNRCLAILPGLLALHPPKASEANNKNSIDNPDTCEQDSDVKTAAATKPEILALGEMKGLLSTNTPTLRLGCMQLEGQRVHTSSKFLVLTIQPKKKRVVCKHIFDSVVLFGQAQVKEAPLEAPEIPQPWVHYGGSARAGTNGTTVSCRQPIATKEAKPRVEQIKPTLTKVIEKAPQHKDSDDNSESDQSIIVDTKDEDDFHMDIAPSSLGRRTSSQRKAKAPVKYQEREPETESSESEEEKPVKRVARVTKKTIVSTDAEDDDVVVVLEPNSQPSTTRASRGKPKHLADALSSSDSEDDYVPLKRPVKAKKTASDYDDDDDDDVVVVPRSRPSSTRAPSQGQKPPAIAKSSTKADSKPVKRAARAKKTSDDSSDEDVVEVLPSGQPASSRASRGRQKSPLVTQSQKEDVVLVGSVTSSRAPRKRNSPPVTQSQDDISDAEASDSDPCDVDHNDDSDDDFDAPPQTSSTTAARKSKDASNAKAPPTKRRRVSAAATDSLASTAATPARRRRRTGTTPSPSKKTAVTKIFQTSNDFSF